MPYALVPIGLSALLAYALSYLLSRTGLLSTTLHRRIWNTALLLTFFTTAVMGIILALQVNYKLDMPVVDKLITWHVDFGIGMSFIAVFHFTWHWSYYWKMIRGKGSPGKELPDASLLDEKMGKVSYLKIPKKEKLPLITLGATAFITQVVLLREYLSIFHGNELVIGIILSAWLLLTGTGALMGSKLTRESGGSRFPSIAFYLLGILPVLTVLGIRGFKNIAFPVGSMAGIPGILLYSLAGMFVFCILAGFLFTWLSSWISFRNRSNLLNFSYALESAGSIAGGIFFSFFLVHILNTFQVLFLVMLLNLGTAIIMRTPHRARGMIILAGASALLLGVLTFWLDLDRISRSFLFRNQEIVETRDSPYGNLVVSKSGEQYTLFENSSPIAASADVASVEEDVHYAMLQHPQPENVLLLSGNIAAMAGELGKYPVREADFVELNPWITRMQSRYMSLPQLPWLNIIHMDGRRFLAGTEKTYDVVLINLPPPGSAQINRFYTHEFFSLLRSHMAPGGVLSIPLQGAENYISPEAGKLYSILYHTLKADFEHVLVVPGMKTYFLASDGELDLDIPSLVEVREIETVYVNSFYLDTLTLRERNAQIMDNLPDSERINRDFRPTAFLHQINYWLSYFRSGLWITLGLFLVFILLTGLRAGSLGTGIFITGFTGMGVELVILLAVQVVFGYVYLYTAIVLTVFMTGLSTGSLFIRGILPAIDRRHFALLQVLLAASVFLIILFLLLTEGITLPVVIEHFAFLSLTFLASFLSGLLFATAALLRQKGIAEAAGGLYSADLAGSAAGALITVLILIPLLGLTGSLVVLVFLNLLGSMNSLFLYRLFSS